jgi:hypothetical protein
MFLHLLEFMQKFWHYINYVLTKTLLSDTSILFYQDSIEDMSSKTFGPGFTGFQLVILIHDKFGIDSLFDSILAPKTLILI